MLNKLKIVGKKYYDFCEYELKNIDKSCCFAQTCKVIDFDKVKEKIVSLHTLQTISSCDGLKICTDKNTIDFIEMKGFEEFKKNNKPTVITIEKQTKKFDFDKKLEQSYFLLQTILSSSNFSATKDDYKNFQSLQKRYFIVTDLKLESNGLESILFGLNFLAESSNVDKMIETCLQDKINGMNVCFLTEKPRLVGCENICKVLYERGESI